MCRHKGMHSLHPLFLIGQGTNHQLQLQFSETKEKNQKSGFTKKFKAQSTQHQNSTFYTTWHWN